jgi:hypothetical protein
MTSTYARYAPMNCSHIPKFSNRIPYVDWLTYLPMFKDEEGDGVALHLIKFHMHACKLKVEWHANCLMKMFMDSMEGKERSLYEKLPLSCICSLNDFHTLFFEHFKESYSSLLLVKNCCEHFEGYIQNIKYVYGNDMFMDDEIIEDIHDNHFHHQKGLLEDSFHDSQDNFQQNVASSLDENQID